MFVLDHLISDGGQITCGLCGPPLAVFTLHKIFPHQQILELTFNTRPDRRSTV